MIFDTHTHLNVSAFEGEEKEVIARAKTSSDAFCGGGIRYGHDYAKSGA